MTELRLKQTRTIKQKEKKNPWKILNSPKASEEAKIKPWC